MISTTYVLFCISTRRMTITTRCASRFDLGRGRCAFWHQPKPIKLCLVLDTRRKLTHILFWLNDGVLWMMTVVLEQRCGGQQLTRQRRRAGGSRSSAAERRRGRDLGAALQHVASDCRGAIVPLLGDADRDVLRRAAGEQIGRVVLPARVVAAAVVAAAAASRQLSSRDSARPAGGARTGDRTVAGCTISVK